MTSIGLRAYLDDELRKLRETDPDKIVDEFEITSEELLEAFYHKIITKLKENYDGCEEESDEEG